MTNAKRVESARPPRAWEPNKKRVTVDDFRRDPLFPGVERAVAAILVSGKVVAPVDVLVRMDILALRDLEAWRSGRVPYLERVVHGSLSRLSRLLRILALHCHDLNLAASQTAYSRSGNGPRTPLRFTKSREERLETVYARHFVWPGKGPFHPPRPRTGASETEPSPQRTAWTELEALVEKNAHEEAIKLATDRQDLAKRDGASVPFAARFEAMRKRQLRRRGFFDRWKRQNEPPRW